MTLLDGMRKDFNHYFLKRPSSRRTISLINVLNWQPCLPAVFHWIVDPKFIGVLERREKKGELDVSSVGPTSERKD